MNKNVNYGNWVPEKMLALCYVAAAVWAFLPRFAWSMAFTCTSVMNCLPSAKAT